MLPLQEDRALSAHLAALQPKPTAPEAQNSSKFPVLLESEGTISFFAQDRGFGFIKADDGSGDAFVPPQTVRNAGLANLKRGDRVRYDAIPSTKPSKEERPASWSCCDAAAHQALAVPAQADASRETSRAPAAQ